MDVYDKIEQDLQNFSKLHGTFCIGEIPDIGAMILILNDLIHSAEKCKPDTFEKVATACRDYVENITLETMTDTKPIEEALVLLKALFKHMKKGAEFMFETSDVMQLLTVSTFKKGESDAAEDMDSALEEQSEHRGSDPEKISDEDMEILIDFVSEAQENLDTIEVSLIELEQDPTDSELINNIFRPFHTIKGVSGFLSLKKINRLSHTTENLLDSARSGDFIINQVATDAILESVDTLKRLIRRVRQGIENGYRPQDDDIDVNRLREKLQTVQSALTDGDKNLLGDILVKKGVIDKETLGNSLEIQKNCPEKKIGEILVEEKSALPGQVTSALTEQKMAKKQVEAQVKVSTKKLDDLVDYAGELVIAQSMLRQKALKDPSLTQSIEQLGQIVTKMQTISMSMRMIPIKATFMKMIRLVRDLSQKSGKHVELRMSGEETEIDRNVVDALYEPMVHMIRNSVDHGIEPGAEREQNGKLKKGNVFLRAYHKGGQIIIEIEDDGKGLDKEKILKKASQMGLVSESESLTDAQIYNLILEPGFSTAAEITDVSGRGVGMDVVKEGIEKFRGHLNIDSTLGRGTKFTISLPLTLAIIDGMLVRVGDEKYVIPTTAIQRAFKPLKQDCFTIEGKAEMLKERDQLIPLVRLKQVHGEAADDKDTNPAWESLVIVVESKDEQRGLLIDELLGKDEYVIKSLGKNLENVKGIAGGAILADGKVGLILDIQGIFKIASRKEQIKA